MLRAHVVGFAAGLFASICPAHAADHVNGTVLYYADSDHVRVLSPSLAGSVEVKQVTAEARTSVDIISAASVDLVSAASPRGFTEQRVQVDASCAYDFGGGRKVGALFGVSRELDFFTLTAGAGASADIFRRSATIGIDYAFSHSDVSRADDSLFARSRVQHQAEVTFSPLLSPTAIADVGYAFTAIEGYQSNPYRYVRLYERGAASHATAVPERTPASRFRHAAVLRLRKRLARPLFALAEYRAYADTWGVLAHSLTARALVQVRAFTLTAEARAYRQTGANFYRRRYDTFPFEPELRTADKQLGPMWTALGGVHVEWAPRLDRVEALRLGAGADVLNLRYLDNALIASRVAAMLCLDATVEF